MMKRFFRFGALLFAGTLFLKPTLGLAESRVYAYHRTMALKAVQKGDLKEALKEATQAVTESPKDYVGWMVRARIYEQTREYAKAAADYTQALQLNPKNVNAWEARGEANFKSGKITEALADFDKFLELVPTQKPYHWQRGIALYYAGRFEEGKKQFELHQTVNPQDVENAVWHYLCTARAEGLESAKQHLIPISQDARIPMAQVHRLFAGKGTPEEVLATAQAAPKMTESGEPLFYAHLYLGIYFEAKGESKKAEEYIKRAATRAKENGYMGNVAEVHAEILKRRSKNSAPKQEKQKAPPHS